MLSGETTALALGWSNAAASCCVLVAHAGDAGFLALASDGQVEELAAMLAAKR